MRPSGIVVDGLIYKEYKKEIEKEKVNRGDYEDSKSNGKKKKKK
jgi:hypothetical protein